VNAEEIRRAIAAFPRWHYQFDLQGQLTPIWHQQNVNRHEQRARYFLEPLVEFFGGSLAGKRVLDLGCNAGFWALRVIEADCSYVVGVDGRKMHIDQANLVFEVNEVPRTRYEFVCADIFDADYLRLGPFDIVLCLGLLYHVSKPVELFERIAATNAEIVLIDTALSLVPGACLEIRHESTEIPTNAIDRPLVLYPTALAVLQIARQFGYSTGIIKPNFTDYTGCRAYQQFKRRAFVAVKEPNLLGPPFEFEQLAVRSQPGLDAAAARQLVARK
jgi:SAM-dependent methyltransferase